VSLYKATKDVICRGIISDNSPKLLYDAIILKDWKKDCELIVTAMASYLF
jgi:hypothetical protein